MPGRIPEALIDTIRGQADIVELISDYVTLKKSGKNYLGLCPFHNEKTPSFNVNPERQIFHCFGCGKGGNVFTFLMEHEKIHFVEAVRMVAARVNIAIPESARDQTQTSENENLYRVTQFAARFFQDQLINSDANAPVRQYIARRGISDHTLVTFSLGYAPDSWDALLRAAEKQGIGAAWLHKAGLVKSTGDRFYDAFRNRLIFPIFSLSGRVVGFGGRALTDEDHPKYLNSPETPIYQKSRIVYGLAQTKDAIRREGRVIIVEGYMDLLSLYQSEVETVAATCGTALTFDQARLFARYAERAVLVYDADAAGARAAIRGLEPLVQAGLWTRVAQLPAGEDPDTYVQKHRREGFLERIAQANSIAGFIAGQFDTARSDEREEALRALANVINKTRDLRHRERYLEEAEKRLPVPQSLLTPILRPAQGVYRDRQQTTPLPKFEDPERELTRLILIDADLALMVEAQLHPDDFLNPKYSAIVKKRFDALHEDHPFDPASLVDDAPDAETARMVSELMATEDSGADRERRAWDYITRIRREQLRRRRAQLQQRIADAEQANPGALPDMLTELQELIAQERALMR